MVAYILTGLAVVVLGIVAWRVLSAREPASDGAPATGGAKVNALRYASTRHLLIAAAILTLAGAGYYAFRPPPGDAPVTPSQAPAADGLPDVDTMIARLEQRLAAEPGDGEGWRMLGWSFVMTGKPEKAVEPYKRALALLPGNASVHAGYGEALTGIAGGTVTRQAKAEFDAARRLDAAEPRSAYFLALWDAQNGRESQALEQWIALANSGPADAPWQGDVHQQIAKLSSKLGVAVSGRLAAAPVARAPALSTADIAAAEALAPAEREAMIDGMVEGLAGKLAKNPADADGWARLLRSRMALGDATQAAKDLTAARRALAGDAAGLAKVAAAASAAGVPGA